MQGICTTHQATDARYDPLNGAVIFSQYGKTLQGAYFKQAFDGLVNRVCHVSGRLAPQNFGVQSAGKLGQSPVANANLRPLRLLQ